jgi:eukaryotic-like serine/threonine-protein kinase
MELEVGSTIGDYQVVGILGAGGMGKVYKVRNAISDRIEAMKVLLPDLVATPELADRFLREIKVLAILEHPNIAQLRTAVRANNQLLMVMEFVDGETLEHRLKQGPLPLSQALDYIGQVLSALEFAHGRGVVHRDIKPANMMLAKSGVVKLMDFGIAKAAADNKLTMTGMTMGSVYYMSPEQIQGVATLDARADLYSVGVTLYELVTGKRPFDGESQYSIMAAHLEKAPVPPITLDPRLPQPLNDAILIAVAKDPNARFQTAAAFRNALGSVAAMIQAPTAPVAAPKGAAAAPLVAAAAAIPPHAAAMPPHAVATAPKSKRWLWMAIGGVAAAAAIVSAIEFAPWKPTKAAAPTQQTSTAQVQPSSPPAEATPVQTPPQDATPAPVTTPESTSQAAPVQPSPAASKSPARNSPNAGSPSRAVSTPPVQQPMQQPPAEAVPVQPQPQPQAAALPPAPAGPGPAEVLHAREHFAKLQVRASTIHDSLENMKRTMQSQGMSLNAKFTRPEALMNTYLQSAENALNQSDLAAAKEYGDKAERQIEILEKLFNQ